MELIIAAILGLASGFGIAWFICRTLPQEKIREINYANFQQEQLLIEDQKKKEREEIALLVKQRVEAWHEYDEVRQEVDKITKSINLLTSEKNLLTNDINHLANKRTDIIHSLELSRQEAEYTAKEFLNQQMTMAQEHLDIALLSAAEKYQAEEEAYKNHYLKLIRDCAKDLQDSLNDLQDNYDLLQESFISLKSNVDSAVAQAKREEEMRQEQNFYRLVIPESDAREISQLRSVEPYLRDKEALNKVIWKVYYEKPYTDMIGRVIGLGVKTGIYKITNMKNQMCYVGQAVNVSDRWKQHIKRGLGAETPTRNKLYPAMAEFGVENFTFELIEECERDMLDAKEDYWQDFYHAKDFGYSIK